MDIITTLTWRQKVRSHDVEGIRELTAKTQVFSEEEIGVAGELIECNLQKGDVSGYHFLFAEYDNHTIGYSCFGPIPFTHKRFDLYWIAVDPHFQHQGVGKNVLSRTEQYIRDVGGLHIYTETSSRVEYVKTRDFYHRNGYRQMAEFSNFYRDGDDKLVYCKYL